MKSLEKLSKLEKEAAEYANKGKPIDPAYANGLFYGYTAGATSKWVEAEKIKAQIDVLNEVNNTHPIRINIMISKLEQKLKKLEDESK